MKFIKCDAPANVRGMFCKKQSLVIEAESMNSYCLRVEEVFDSYNKKKNFCATFNSAAKSMNKTHMRARIVNKEVYVFNSLVNS